eukprot:1716461-Amphidinium_carterae.4
MEPSGAEFSSVPTQTGTSTKETKRQTRLKHIIIELMEGRSSTCYRIQQPTDAGIYCWPSPSSGCFTICAPPVNQIIVLVEAQPETHTSPCSWILHAPWPPISAVCDST